MVQNKPETIRLESVDSTNNKAKRLIAGGKTGAFSVIADEQTGGRGRLGRSFYSPKDTGIYMSFAYVPKGEIKDSVCITAATAVCVCRAIEKLTDKRPKIKWVNDVYLENKKICGILTEAVLNPQGEYSVIIGIGVNISTFDFPDNVENAGSLCVNIDKDELINEITGELLCAVNGDKGDFIHEYRERSIVLGKRVKVINGNQTFSAEAVDIDENGALIIKTENGRLQTLSSGEVSLRFTED